MSLFAGHRVTIGELEIAAHSLFRMLIIIKRPFGYRIIQREGGGGEADVYPRPLYMCTPAAFSIRTNGRIEFGDPAAFRFCANIDAPWRDAIALALYASSAAPLRTRVRGIEFW